MKSPARDSSYAMKTPLAPPRFSTSGFSPSPLAFFLILFFALLATLPAVRAANTWTTSGTTAITNGNGTWSLAGGNFTDGTTANQNWVNGNDATFAGNTAATVTLGSAITAGNITFSTTANDVIDVSTFTLTLNTGFTGLVGNVTIQGAGGIVLGGNNTWNNVSTTNISTPISGGFSLTKTNSGTLNLTVLNTYSGQTQIDQGQVNVSLLANQGTASNLGTGNGTSQIRLGNSVDGILNYTGTGTSTDRQIQMGTNAVGFGGGAIFNNGSGNLVFGNSTSFTGGTVTAAIGARTLTLGGGNGTNEIVGTIANNNGNSTVGLTKVGASTWKLTGANTFTGDTLVNAGTLALNNALALQNSALNTAGAGNINVTGFTTPTLGGLKGGTALASVITSGYGSVTNLTLNNNAGATSTYSGIIADGAAGMTVTKTGTGTQILSGANTYTGATTINAGILQFANNAAGSSTPSIAVNNAGSTLAVNYGGGSDYIQPQVDTLLLNTTFGTATTAFGFDTTNGSGTYANALTMAAGLTKLGTNTLNLTGVNTYTGTTTINAGTLDLGGGTATGSLASPTLTLNGGAFNYSTTGSPTQNLTTTNINGGTVAITAVSGNTLNLGTIARGVGGVIDFASSGGTISTSTLNTSGILGGWATYGGTTWAVANGNGTTVTGLASGSYYTTVTGGTTAANYLNQNVDVTSSPGTTIGVITANSLRFNSSAGAYTLTLAAGNNTVTTGGILVSSNVGANLSTITGGNLTGANNADLVVIQNNTSANLTIASVIKNNSGNATALTKTGAGNLTLSGANVFTGGMAIKAGTVLATNAGALGSNATGGSGYGTVTLGDTSGSTAATLLLGATVNNLIVLSSGTAGTLTLGSTGNVTAGGLITGANNLNISGSGPLTLTAVNNSGTITDNNTGAVTITNLGGNVTAVTVATGATGNLTITNVEVNSAGTTFTNNATAAGAGLIVGTVTGTGDAILKVNTATAGPLSGSSSGYYNIGNFYNSGTGSNSYTVGTLNNIGSMTNNATGSGNFSVSTVGSNVTGITQNSTTMNMTVTTLNVNAAGTTLTNIAGIGVLNGGNATGTGNLVLNNNSATANGVALITANNTGTITNSGNGTGNVVITGAIGTNVTGVIQNSATSALSLNATNTYTGPTTVKSGTLKVQATSSSSNAFGGNGTIIVGDAANTGAAATLEFNSGNAFPTFLNAISITGNGTDTISATSYSPIFAGNVTLSNNLNILSNNSMGSFLTFNGTIAGPGNVHVTVQNGSNAGSYVTFNGNINNAGTLTFDNISYTGNHANTITGGVGSNVTAITQASSNSPLTINATAIQVNSVGTTLTASGAALFTVSGGITGTGNLTLNTNNNTSGILVTTTTINNIGTVTNSGNGTAATTISSAIGREFFSVRI